MISSAVLKADTVGAITALRSAKLSTLAAPAAAIAANTASKLSAVTLLNPSAFRSFAVKAGVTSLPAAVSITASTIVAKASSSDHSSMFASLADLAPNTEFSNDTF